MIFGKNFVSSLIFSGFILLAAESEFINSLIPAIGWSAVGLILAFTSWFLFRGFANTILRPFSRIPKKHRVVFVTGCDSGFGLLIVKTLSRMGYFVFAGCLNQELIEDCNKLLKELSSKVRFIHLDVTKKEDIENAVDIVKFTLKKELGDMKLYGLINCAGIMRTGIVEFAPTATADDFSEVLDVNVLGAIRVTRAFLPLIRESQGRIINISSMMSRIAAPGMATYSVSKAALSKFTECLQVEMTPFGVRAIGVEPWMVEAEVTSEKQLMASLNSSWESAEDEVKRAYGKSYFQQLLRFIQVFTNLPYDVRPEQTVRVIVDALTVAEPDPVYRVINPFLGLPLWIINDILSWEYVVFIRKLLFWSLFKLLSIESYFRK